MFTRLLIAGAILTAFSAALFGSTAGAAPPDPCGDMNKPKAPGAGIQAGVSSAQDPDGSGPVASNFPSTSNRAETQIAHESSIVAPTGSCSSYSYSLVGETDTGYVLRMGYIVLAGENGLARFFIAVYNSGGSIVYWNLSRAGATNPPPACSACSGDSTTLGYPYAFGLDGANTWNFWFDWILKARVRVKGSGSSLVRVFFLGEVSRTGAAMDARKALTTFRVTTNQAAWTEPGHADAYYSGAASCNMADGSQLADYDIEPAGTHVRNDNMHYRSTKVGTLTPPGDSFGATTLAPCNFPSGGSVW